MAVLPCQPSQQCLDAGSGHPNPSHYDMMKGGRVGAHAPAEGEGVDVWRGWPQAWQQLQAGLVCAGPVVIG